MVAKDSRAFVTNDRVMHNLFGLGTVIGSDPRKTVIEFDDNNIRKFVTSLVQLEKAADEAPKPKKSRAKSRAKKAAAAPKAPRKKK